MWSRVARTRSRGRRAARGAAGSRGGRRGRGAGLLELVRGLYAGVSGRPCPRLRRRQRARARLRGAPPGTVSLSLLRRSWSRVTDSMRRSSNAKLEPLGDSLLVVGDSSALKVHVHTDEPGAALPRSRRREARSKSRSRTCAARRSSASADSRLRWQVYRRSRQASSQSSPAKETGGCSRATARRG